MPGGDKKFTSESTEEEHTESRQGGKTGGNENVCSARDDILRIRKRDRKLPSIGLRRSACGLAAGPRG